MKQRIIRQHRFGTIDVTSLLVHEPGMSSEFEAAVSAATEAAQKSADEDEEKTNPDDDLSGHVACMSDSEIMEAEHTKENRTAQHTSSGEVPLVRPKQSVSGVTRRPSSTSSSSQLHAVRSPNGEELVDPAWLDEPTLVMSMDQINWELDQDARRLVVETAEAEGIPIVSSPHARNRS